jgi:cellulose synthase operon protein C
MLRRTLPLLFAAALALPPLARAAATPAAAPAGAAPAAPPAPSTAGPAQLQAVSARALQLAGSPRGAAQLVRLHGLSDELESLAPLAAVYRQVLARKGVDPGTRDTARLLLLDVERAQGNLDAASAQAKALGFVGDFYVAGGFDNEGKAGCDRDFGPEAAALDLTQKYVGVGGREVTWRKLPVRPLDGSVDLGAALRPNRGVVAYALTYLEAPRATRVQLGVGTSGAFRLFVNGEKALASERYNAPRPDQAQVSVQLRKGLNRVLLKVCQDSGALGFYLRQGPAGAGDARATVSLPERLPALAQGAPAAPRPLPTVNKRFAALVARAPQDGALRLDYARALAFSRAYDEREHTAAVEAERAAQALPRDAEAQLLAALLHDDDMNLRRRFLERALSASAAEASGISSVDARVALAEHELRQGHPERALPLAESAVKDAPRSPGARLMLVRTLDALGEQPRAQALLEQSLALLPRQPAVVRGAARASARMERPAETVQRLRAALQLRADDRGSRRALASKLADMADVEGAAKELRTLLTQDPFDNGVRLQLAELLGANGQPDTSAALFAEARALSPDEPEVYEREGHMALTLGKRQEALAALERSLLLRPQNPGLRDVLCTLKGEEAGGGAAQTQYRVDVQPLVREADAFANEDAVLVVDSTFVRVQRSGLSSRQHQLAVKVLNTRGLNAFRTYPITYSPDRQEVRILRARITKADGTVVDGYSENERSINDASTGMYYDVRAKVLSFSALAAGDLLELEYRLDDTAQDNLLSDYWGDVDSIQSTYPKVRYQFLVEMPKERPLYWNQAQLSGVSHQQEELQGGRTLYRWSAKSVSKVVPEPAMPGWAEVATQLHVSTYQSWEQVGRYYWGLVRDQLTPNEELRRTVDEVLTRAGVDRKDELAVVHAIYNFVVTNTRYVALEFGIHGYKPYRVDRVLSRRFGDCKDKASLIHAMLKVAGVDSRLVLLRMRDLGALSGQPASLAAFNHAIAYVPKFDLYLDGTAEFHGASELPSADRVANVLVVEPEGGSRFLTTPEARAEDNLTELNLQVALQPDGSAGLSGGSRAAGQSAPQYRRAYQSPATRKSTLERAWAQTFPGLTVKEVKLSDPTRLDQAVAVDFQMQVPRYAEASPGALRFLAFGSPRSYVQSYAPLVERRYDLVMSTPWTNRFTLRYQLPAGYRIDQVPPAYEETTPFGRVRLVQRVEAGQLVADGELALTTARVKAEDYAAFRAFLGRIDQAFGRKATAVREASTAARPSP